MGETAQTAARRRGDRLLQLGAALFLIGLVSGLLTGLTENPRMGLSAHLQGVINGVLLLAVGAIWPRLGLAPWQEAIAFWCLVYGAVANWLAVQLAAFWGAGAMLPIAAPDRRAEPWQEAVVSFGLLSLTVAMLIAGALLFYGLLRIRR